MPQRYFVKELNPREKQRELGRYSLIYEGQDGKLAHGIAENLDKGHLFIYDWNLTTKGATVTHMTYNNGKHLGFGIRGMSTIDPLVSLVQNNSLLQGLKLSMSELLEEFTPREKDFLEGIARDTKAA